MSINQEHFDKAMLQLEQRRVLNRLTEQQRRSEVYEKLPEYRMLEQQLAKTSNQLINIILRHKDNAEENLKKLEKNNLEIQQNMSALLKQGGFAADFLEPIYYCKACRDKGSVNGQWCGCFQRLMLAAAAEDLNSVSPLKLCSFESFRTDLYSDLPDPQLGVSPRKVAEHNLQFCKRYAEEFTGDSDSVFMYGATGLGKTHLSLAIANEVMKHSHSVIYGSAPELLRTLEREYYGRSTTDTMQLLTDCDLLILDDLGAELDKPVYTALIYELVNTRISRSKPIIASSNLSPESMQKRYQDRIWSRLFYGEVLMFIGEDIRIKKLK